jgi:hypothetical protein
MHLVDMVGEPAESSGGPWVIDGAQPHGEVRPSENLSPVAEARILLSGLKATLYPHAG